MLLSELLTRGAKLLADAGIDSAEVDAQLLAAHVLGISRGEIQAKLFLDPEIPESAEILELFQKRSERIPLQHLTGVAHFRNLTLAVGPGVFIPRPETEGVVGLALEALPQGGIAVDLCTGSGAIAISIATEAPESRVYAWELNPDSEKYLRQNLRGNVELVMGDISDEHQLFDELAGLVDVVVSNPPYIPTWAVPKDLEVQLHDPALALYGGQDGLDIIRVVSRRAMELLKPGGYLVVEHADTQGQLVADLFQTDGWNNIAIHQDMTGRDRSVSAIKPL
jgi:release factor glutamine methyltransferase